MWDAGSGTRRRRLQTLVPILGYSTPNLLTDVTITGLTSGTSYIFTYYATNAHGDGPHSDPVTVLAATVPAIMNAPTVSTVSQHTSLHYRITVIAPHSGGTGVAISGYEITFKQSDGVTYTAITAECPTNGATITNLYCDVSLSSLTAAPFSLPLGAEVVAKVRAQNTLGDGDYSADSSGSALIVTIPNAPAAVPYRNEATCTETSITINMPVVSGQTDTGGLSILSYKLEMAVGASGTFSALVGDGPASTATSYTKTGLTTGEMYRFRYIVSNEVGWSSDYSPILTTYAAVAPG
jgi:hypothetical protein